MQIPVCLLNDPYNRGIPEIIWSRMQLTWQRGKLRDGQDEQAKKNVHKPPYIPGVVNR